MLASDMAPRGLAVLGRREGDQVTCPRHGAVFRITTGEVLRPPAQTAVAAYTVRVSGKNVEVEI